MDSLYKIFQREKVRVGDKFTVFYNQKKNLLQYSNNEGTLTVLFDAKKGTEDFYYRPNDTERDSGLGTLIQQNIEHGHRAVLTKEVFDICSQDFIDLCADYQFNRDSIGVERAATRIKREKTRSSFERD